MVLASTRSCGCQDASSGASAACDNASVAAASVLARRREAEGAVAWAESAAAERARQA